MRGAILQGVPATTLDTDLWVDLPSRQSIRVLNLCRGLGGEVRANTVVDLPDGSVVNFLYEVHGLRTFRYEYQRARKMKWLGTVVAVLPLERIYAVSAEAESIELMTRVITAGLRFIAAGRRHWWPRKLFGRQRIVLRPPANSRRRWSE
jgi:hypothetical protein